jgi:thiazole synthase
MELGADGVLINTAIAIASDPIRMAIAFKSAVEAGRMAYEVGLGHERDSADPTSPLETILRQNG